MSAFLGFESFLIPLGSTAQTVQDTLKTAITSHGWQCVQQSVIPIAYLGTATNPSYAFSSNLSLSADDAAILPKWLGCQLTTVFTPIEMYLQCDFTPNNAPASFSLDWSDNGSSWTVHQSFTGVNYWGCFERRRFNITAAPAKNYWRLNVTARNSGSSTSINSWSLKDASNNFITDTNAIYVIPPVGQTIGNSVAREIIHISNTTTSINIRPVQELLTPLQQLMLISGVTAGAITCSITIGGITVSYTGSAPNTSLQNARGLYEAVKNSLDANFLAWNWLWIVPIMNIAGSGQITAVSKALTTTNSTMSATNATVNQAGTFHGAMIGDKGSTMESSLTIDTINGFIYYLQVNSRGLALATKTNVGFYGPFHMCYGDNTAALSQIPDSQLPGIPCTPIELIVGYDDISTTSGGLARPSHWWGSSVTGTGIQQSLFSSYAGINIWTNHVMPGLLQDVGQDYSSGQYSTTNSIRNLFFTMRGEGVYTGVDPGLDFAVHRLACDPDTVLYYDAAAVCTCRGCGPVLVGLDWYRYSGTLSNEQLVFAPSTDFVTTLTANISAVATIITVASTTGFPAAGFLFIEMEVIQYTGVTATTFTGCTRAKYGSSAAASFTGTSVNIGAWLVKINTGLLLAGYSKPV